MLRTARSRLALLLCLLSSAGACALADAVEPATDPAGLETLLAAADMPPAQRVDGLLQAAEAAKSRRRDDALRLASSALDQARAAGLASGQWRARLLLADLSMAARDLAAAKTHLDAAESMQAHPDVQPLRAQWLYLQGRWLRDSKRDAESAARFVEAAELAARAGDDATEAKALHSHAMMLLRSGEQEQARAQLQRSLELNLSAGRERDADANRHYLGQIARDLGDYALALSLHEQVLAHSEQRADQQGIANSANAIAILQAHKNEDELALPYFERAAAAYRLLGDPHGTSMALANLGYSLSRLGRAEQAAAPLQEALSIALQAKDRDAEALALTLLAEAELGAGRLEQSEQLADRAHRIGVERNDQAIVASALVALSKVRFAQARPAAARDLLTQALPYIRAAARSADLRDNLGALAAAQAATGDYASAYAIQLEVATLSTKLQDERMAQRLAELRAAHEAQTRELELSAQRTRIEALELQARAQQRIRYLMAAGLASAFALLLALVSRARNKQRAERALQAHNALIEKTNQELAEAADTDVLTGVRNRRHFQRLLLPRLEAAVVQGEAFGLVLIDADRFKSINDGYGHDVGDRALCAIAHAWRDVLEPGDTLVRWGGEEFLAVLPQAAVERTAQLVARGEQAVRALTVPTDRGTLRLSTSAGWIGGVWHGTAVERLLQLADHALLRAKQSGRDRAIGVGYAANVQTGTGADPLAGFALLS